MVPDGLAHLEQQLSAVIERAVVARASVPTGAGDGTCRRCCDLEVCARYVGRESVCVPPVCVGVCMIMTS